MTSNPIYNAQYDRAALREGDSRRAEYFRYKDQVLTFAMDDVHRVAMILKENPHIELNAILQELNGLIPSGTHSDDDPIWDKACENLDLFVSIFNSLLNSTEKI